MSNRLGRIEQHVAHRNNLVEQGLTPAIIVANAAQKAAMFQAQRYAERIDEMIEDDRQKKIQQANPERGRDIHGGIIGNEPPPDDRHEHMKFDPSSGQHAQKSMEHPMGDSNFVTAAEAKAMFAARDAKRQAEHKAFLREAAQNKAFNQNQHALVRAMKSQIDGAMKERWK